MSTIDTTSIKVDLIKLIYLVNSKFINTMFYWCIVQTLFVSSIVLVYFHMFCRIIIESSFISTDRVKLYRSTTLIIILP